MLLATIPAHFAANLAQGSSLAFCTAAASAGGLSALTGSQGLRALGFDRSLASPRDLLALVLVGAVASPAIAAFAGATSLAVGGLVAWGEWPRALREWWIGDGMGVLLVAPPILLAERDAWILSRAGRAEALAASATLLLVSLAVFGSWLPLATTHYPLSFAVLPVLLWAAYRLEPFGAACASLLVAGVATGATLGGLGPFAGVSRDESIYLMWAFLAVASLT